MIHIIAQWMGLHNGAGEPYLFWSGIGSDIQEVLLFAGLIHLIRLHNCHVKGCKRLGRHKVSGTEFIVCRRHHPDDAPSHAQVLADHDDVGH